VLTTVLKKNMQRVIFCRWWTQYCKVWFVFVKIWRL